MWDELTVSEGCLISATDIKFSTEGSVFRRKNWQRLIDLTKKDKGFFDYLINLFPSTKSTKVHICNWENSTEGLLAVFTIQQITRLNWNTYDGNNPLIVSEKNKNTYPKYRRLKKILANKNACKELQTYYSKKYSDSQKKAEITP